MINKAEEQQISKHSFVKLFLFIVGDSVGGIKQLQVHKQLTNEQPKYYSDDSNIVTVGRTQYIIAQVNFRSTRAKL